MIKAVIFDLDGTVLDNEGWWEEAFQAVVESGKLRVESFPRQPNGWLHEPGLGLVPNWRRIVKDPKLAEDLAFESRRIYVQRSKQEVLMVKSGTEELIARIKERGWRTALCTGSYWFMVQSELEKLQLQLAFDVTTTGEEVMLPKPDPEIYLLTAQKLNLEPRECLVIEDAVAGVRAAVEAGMQAVGLVSDYAPEEMLLAAGASAVIENFGQFEANNDGIIEG